MREFELERLMLHRLTELDADVRAAYATYDYRKVVAVLSQFMNTELSAFYFDIRKDALYCEPYSSVKRARRAHGHRRDLRGAPRLAGADPVVHRRRSVAGALCPRRDGSVHLEAVAESSAAWRDDELAAKWDRVRDVRRVVTGALEIERANKRIGSSLEAAPEVYIADPDLLGGARGRRLGGSVHHVGSRSLPSRRPRAPSRCRTCRVSASSSSARKAGSARARGASPTMSAPIPTSRPVGARRRGRSRNRSARAGMNGMTTNAGLAAGFGAGGAARPCGCSRDRGDRSGAQVVDALGLRHCRKGRVEVSPFLDLVFVKNIGISYSLFNQDSSAGQILAGGLRGRCELRSGSGSTGRRRLVDGRQPGLIIGGAIGNAIDRLDLGGVADFFSLHAYGFYWYVFNIADVAIVAGVAGLLYESLMASRKAP